MNKVQFKLAAALVLAMLLFGCGGDNDDLPPLGGAEPSTNITYGASVQYGGETYQTVVIGNQTWFARNLNYNVEGSKCYDEDWENYEEIHETLTTSEIQANCAKYGRLYNWNAAMTACPVGWHLPTNEEWDALYKYIDSDYEADYESESGGYSKTAGKYLKATNSWKNNGNGLDIYGFAALPGGVGSYGNFYDIGSAGNWWSASEGERPSLAYFRLMDYLSEGAGWFDNGKGVLNSVRCVKDSAEGSSSSSGGSGNGSSSSFAAQSPFWELEVNGANAGRGLTGVWFSYDDRNVGSNGKGGCAKTSFPTTPSCSDDFVSAEWKANPEITYSYEGDCDYKYPFAGIGFTLKESVCFDESQYNIATTVPAPEKILYRDGGIKVWYKLEGNGLFGLYMSTADVPDGIAGAGITGFDEFYIGLPKGNFLEDGREFFFKDFEQECCWGTMVSLEQALDAITGFRFKGDFRSGYLTEGEKKATLTITKMKWIDRNGN